MTNPIVEKMQIPRDELALLWELPASGKPVKEALSPVRAMDHLDLLLTYHGLDYVDAFVMEIPWNLGGEVRGANPRACFRAPGGPACARVIDRS